MSGIFVSLWSKNEIMSKKYHVDLSVEDKVYLEAIVAKRQSTSEMSKRSQLLLAADRNGSKNWKDSEISSYYKVNVRTIERLRERYVMHGLMIALKGLPRLNLDKIKFDGVVESKLIALRCSEPGVGRSSWTLQLLSDKMVELSYVESISTESVRLILKKTKLSLGA
jgi:hypothetical protein